MKLKLLLPLAFLALSTTQVTAQYCAPDLFFGCTFGDEIDDFTVTGINSTMINDLNTGCTPTTYWEIDLANTVTFAPGGSYAATVVSGTTDDNVQVWIDFNDDFTFGSGESVGGLNGVGISTLNFNIAIPMGAATGSHRMRVFITGDGTYPSIDPCPELINGYGTGEVHDYTAVISGTTCNPPTGASATTITFDGAMLSWNAIVGASGYEYVLDQVAGNPSGAGTGIALNSYPASGLMSGTLYYFHVRSDCGSGNFSTWVTISFTTSACPAPTGVTESAITATTATVSWTAVIGAQGYQYAVNTSMTPPATGTYTTNASNPVTGLTANTQYHTWVRTVCGVGDTSAWSAMHMWTTLPVSVVDVNGGGFSLQAYPNPAKNILTVAALGKGNTTATIQLTDVTGKLVNSYTLSTEEMNIDMSGLSSGVYFIRYADKEHRQTIKVNKE